MCILLNVKKHEKTFALNVDIFRIKKYNTECDIKNFDLLYTEIALRNEY